MPCLLQPPRGAKRSSSLSSRATPGKRAEKRTGEWGDSLARGFTEGSGSTPNTLPAKPTPTPLPPKPAPTPLPPKPDETQLQPLRLADRLRPIDGKPSPYTARKHPSRILIVMPIPDDVVPSELQTLMISRVGAVTAVKIHSGVAHVYFRDLLGWKAVRVCEYSALVSLTEVANTAIDGCE